MRRCPGTGQHMPLRLRVTSDSKDACRATSACGNLPPSAARSAGSPDNDWVLPDEQRYVSSRHADDRLSGRRLLPGRHQPQRRLRQRRRHAGRPGPSPAPLRRRPPAHRRVRDRRGHQRWRRGIAARTACATRSCARSWSRRTNRWSCCWCPRTSCSATSQPCSGISRPTQRRVARSERCRPAPPGAVPAAPKKARAHSVACSRRPAACRREPSNVPWTRFWHRRRAQARGHRRRTAAESCRAPAASCCA